MYAKHRFNIFPEMQYEDYQMLVNDIKTNGFDAKQPIYLFEGDVLDGWNRHRACTELNITPVYMQYKGTNEEALMFVLRTNKRRNLTPGQKAAIAADAEEMFIAIAEETEKEKIKKQSENAVNRFTKINEVSSGKLITPSYQDKQNQKERDWANWKEKEDAKTATKIARMFDTNSTYVKAARKIKRENPNVFEQIKSGEKTITEVKKEEKKEAVKVKEQEYKEEIAAINDFDIDIFNTDKKFNIIYADPAWSYWEGGEKNQSLHYQTMGIEEIKNLPVSNISDDNCILFLWVTFPILKEAFDVIQSWGFKYSTCGFVWVKKNKNADSYFFGNGAWTRANSELCLIATKGSIMRMDASISQVLDDRIMEHSQKPQRVRQLITKLVGELPRIELFSRNENTDGWFNWGNKI